MDFEIQPTEGNAWKLVLFGAPGNVHALTCAPEAMEPELSSGTWLVVVFPVWSGPVRRSVRAACSYAEGIDGKLQLGVRPFENYEEIVKWWPTSESPPRGAMLCHVNDASPLREVHIATDSSSYPMWLVLRDGAVLYEGAGPRTKEQIAQLVQAALA